MLFDQRAAATLGMTCQHPDEDQINSTFESSKKTIHSVRDGPVTDPIPRTIKFYDAATKDS